MEERKLEMLDITAPEVVEVRLRDDNKVLWVNVDGFCRLRICQIGAIALHVINLAEREKIEEEIRKELKEGELKGFAKAMLAWTSAIVDHFPVVDLSDRKIWEMAKHLDEDCTCKEHKDNFYSINFADGSSVTYEHDQT